MDINRHYLKAPTEIVTTTLGIPEEYKQQCIQEAYKIGDKQGKQTNVKAIMSSYWVWKDTIVYDLLIKNILSKSKAILPILDERYEYKLLTCWSAIYKDGHYTVSHSHLPSVISFVYYLKANDNSSPLIFDGCSFEVQPYDDLLVVFPSYLMHNVPKHYGEDRVCLAGNLSMFKI